MTDTIDTTADVERDLLPADLVAAFLRRLGLPTDPQPTLDTLCELYRHWCARVPYDNYRIRRSLTDRPEDEVVGVSPDRLLTDNIADGNASQCTETADALYLLLRSLGFSVELCLAYYGPTSQPPLMANHVTVIATIGSDRYLVDTVILSGHPIPLREHEATYPPLVYTVTRDAAGGWRVDSVTPVGRSPVSCRLIASTVDRDVCAQVYRNVQDDGFADFNATFYGRRNVDGTMITFSTPSNDRSRSFLHRTSLDGTVSTECRTRAERDRALREGLGFSAAHVARVPADRPPS